MHWSDVIERLSRIALCALIFTACSNVGPSHTEKRALLIGINDYATVRPVHSASIRDWPNLKGAVNDVHAMRDLLIAQYGFRSEDVIVLTDEDATRQAILTALEHHLVQSTKDGDVVLFYYAGHGSQVPNSLSDEPDHLDESIVPADSRAGVPDIRDKELRSYFNRILGRGAKLTVMLDACHSASGARTFGIAPRGIAPDDLDVADNADYGPRPERAGALVLSATEDFDRAWEVRDDRGQWHGAFSWAWLRSAREAETDESAADTFQRARARMAVEKPFQIPVLGGLAEARRTPFLSTGIRHRNAPMRIAIARTNNDGTVALQGGFADGLTIGKELRATDSQQPSHLVVTSVEGPGRSTACLQSTQRRLAAGSLLEVTASTPSLLWLQQAPESHWSYTLGIRRARDHAWAVDTVVGGDRYDLVLRRRSPSVDARYVYVVVVDSEGTSTLLYPRDGSVENRFPNDASSDEISLGDAAAFEVTAPYGLDTYILFTTDEPLADPYVLQSDPARGSSQRLAHWSIERVTLRSVPRHKSGKGVSGNVTSSARGFDNRSTLNTEAALRRRSRRSAVSSLVHRHVPATSIRQLVVRQSH
jgi:hypothetical protein